jgi:hypothetical protein
MGMIANYQYLPDDELKQLSYFLMRKKTC